jgi:RNA polymerase sigma-70 factor (ECF subfamily)
VTDGEWLASRFEGQRAHLRAVAHRMLGSQPEAEDAVQDAWLRTSRAGVDGVDNLGGWLTTVVARVCLDRLRARKARREDALADAAPVHAELPAAGPSPEHDAVVADSVGVALLVVLETLTPAERVAFVLHDLFDVPFDDVASIVGRTPDAARQLASRARRRVQGRDAAGVADRERQRDLVAAFLAASRSGDLGALLALLDPDVVVRADAAAVRMGAAAEVRGPADVAGTFAKRAQAARLADIDGVAGLAWGQGGETRVVFVFTTAGDRITDIELVADADRIARLTISPAGD